MHKEIRNLADMDLVFEELKKEKENFPSLLSEKINIIQLKKQPRLSHEETIACICEMRKLLSDALCEALNLETIRLCFKEEAKLISKRPLLIKDSVLDGHRKGKLKLPPEELISRQQIFCKLCKEIDNLSSFDQRMDWIKILTHEVKYRFSRIIPLLQSFLGRTGKSPLPQLANLRKNFDQAISIRNKVVVGNLRLVLPFLNGQEPDFLDFLQEGTLGLMRAVEDFMPEMGGRYSTFAYWWIRQGIFRYRANQKILIRIPVYMQDAIGKINKADKSYQEEFGEKASNEELAKLTKLSIQKIEKAPLTKHIFFSLSEPCSISDDANGLEPFENILADPKGKKPDEIIATRYDLQVIFDKEISLWFTPREEKILRRRFGYREKRCYTLQEVGNFLEISRERVRQIEARALKFISKLLAIIEQDFNWFKKVMSELEIFKAKNKSSLSPSLFRRMPLEQQIINLLSYNDLLVCGRLGYETIKIVTRANDQAIFQALVDLENDKKLICLGMGCASFPTTEKREKWILERKRIVKSHLDMQKSEILKFSQSTHKTKDVESAFLEVQKLTNVTKEEILKKCRESKFVHARWLFIAVLRDELKLSFSKIGKILNLDHATVMHGYDKMKKNSRNFNRIFNERNPFGCGYPGKW